MPTPSKRKSMRTASRPGKAGSRSGVLAFRSDKVKLLARVADKLYRDFEGCAYTGGLFFPSIVFGGEMVSGPAVLDLDSLRIPSQIRPMLDEHDESTDGKIGETRKVAVENYQLNVSGIVFTEKERSKKILDASDAGSTWQLSIGMDQFSLEFVPAGRSVEINGQSLVGPFTIVRNAYLTEISFVSVGGDDVTWVTIAAAKRFTRSFARLTASKSAKGVAMFEEWMKQNFPSIDLTKVDPTELANYKTQYAALQAAGDDDDDEELEEELTEEEEERILATARRKKALKASRGGSGRKLGTDGASMDKVVDRAVDAATKATRIEAARVAHIRAVGGDDHEAIEKAIAEGTDSKDFELARLRAGRSKPSGASTKVDDDEALVMECALLCNVSFDREKLPNYFDEKVIDRATSKRYQGFSLVECADRIIRHAGVHYDGMRSQKGHMMAYRNAENKLTASGYTTMALSSILENAMDKVLLNQYAAVETVWQMICAIRSLSDFKIHSQYALDPTSVFVEVGPQGDFSNMSFSDRKYSLQAGSFGTRLKIDFQTWRNDDLGSISDRVGGVGTLGAQTIDQVVNYLLMSGINNTSLFHANNRNYVYDSTATFGIAGLKVAETLWENQVRPNQTPLGISPQTLMVGTALKTDAGQVFTSAKLNEVFTTAQTRTGPVASDNPFVSKYKPQVNPYLNNTLLKNGTRRGGPVAFPKQNSKLWMLLARQGNIAPLHIGFLDGQQGPRIEIINNQSEMVGFELAAGMFFGVGYGDPLLASCFDPDNAGGA